MARDARLQGSGRAGLATWLLAAACAWAALLWLGALLGMGGRIEPGVPAGAGALPVPAPAQPDRIGPLAQYGSAASRPLFTPDRRPRTFLATAPEPGQDVAQAERLEFVLSGVLISPQVRLAVLQPAAGGESQRVQVGQSPEGAAGWRLVDVQPRRAIFEGHGGQQVLDLRSFGVVGAPVVAQGGVASEAANTAAVAAEAAAAAAAQGSEARTDAIRRRIEARRAQLRNRDTTAAPPPASGVPRQ